MSDVSDLRDLRAKISVEGDVALDAVARVTGKDRSELVRDIVHRWALDQLAIATLIDRRMKAEGIDAGAEGARGRDLTKT